MSRTGSAPLRPRAAPVPARPKFRRKPQRGCGRNPAPQGAFGRKLRLMAESISVLICDDHALVRSGLRRLLEAEPEIEVVGEAADAEEAIAATAARQPDVLLLDVVMPGRSGIEALPELTAAAPATRVLVLSMQDDPSYVRQAFAAGAAGYLLKEAADADLLPAIRDGA